MTSRGWALGAFLVGALAAVPFLPSLEGQFLNWDDNVNFVFNPHYRGLGWREVTWMFTTTHTAIYAPLAWVTLGLNYLAGGMNPWGYHLGNLLLHAANTGLFFLLSRRLLALAFEREVGIGQLPLACGATVAALTFGVHPLRVESVAWITERRDVLGAFFYLLAVLAYLRGVAQGAVIRGWWLGASLAAFLAALLSKGITMTLPLTLLVLDMYPLRRWRLGWRALVAEKLPYAALAALAATAALVAIGQSSTWTGLESYGPTARVAMVGYSLWFYPWKLVWPDRLSPLYELPMRIDPLEARFLVPMIAVAGVSFVLFRLRRRLPGGLAAWGHSVVVLAPVSGIVHAGHQLAHDRFSYLSGLGFAVLAGAIVAWVVMARRRERLKAWLTLLVLLVASLSILGWAAGTWRQSRAWRDSEALWRMALQADEACAICHNSLGGAIVGDGTDAEKLWQAEAHFRRAIEIRPHYSNPHYNLGRVLARQQRYEEAEAFLTRFAGLEPGNPAALAALGMVYVDLGRHGAAIPLLRVALRLTPELAAVRRDLGRALNAAATARVRQGNLGEAATLLHEAVEIGPDDGNALTSLGAVLVMLGRGQDAVAPLRHALEVDSRDAPARFWLARAYALTGERMKAQAEKAALQRIDPQLAERLDGHL
jgi:Flp pilus assembly protein TadD